ncbi:hypothetical protein P3W85_43315 [Cupriavidus basilensis]|uniref:Uncharacterized protein n=1 Tax=Cupriavidus basilensis TaxID=68895 RepID=A0ABT6B4A3_9BURK|nr:hypothetical protein [Cupriavidus basilensis]MDF3839721.1 hypothetical protein [Cupriavidus basilensis]
MRSTALRAQAGYQLASFMAKAIESQLRDEAKKGKKKSSARVQEELDYF